MLTNFAVGPKKCGPVWDVPNNHLTLGSLVKHLREGRTAIPNCWRADMDTMGWDAAQKAARWRYVHMPQLRKFCEGGLTLRHLPVNYPKLGTVLSTLRKGLRSPQGLTQIYRAELDTMGMLWSMDNLARHLMGRLQRSEQEMPPTPDEQILTAMQELVGTRTSATRTFGDSSRSLQGLRARYEQDVARLRESSAI